MERKYSLSEIDRMRDAIKWSYPSGFSYRQQERDADIESRLRTYMQNGTDPEELEAAASARISAEQAAYRRQNASAEARAVAESVAPCST